MGERADIAATVVPPREGQITVTAVTASTATSAIEHGAAAGQFVSIGVDDGSTDALPVWWVTFGESDVTAPAPTNTSTDAQTFGPFQGVESFRPRTGESHYRLIATADGYVRSYPSS